MKSGTSDATTGVTPSASVSPRVSAVSVAGRSAWPGTFVPFSGFIASWTFSGPLGLLRLVEAGLLAAGQRAHEGESDENADAHGGITSDSGRAMPEENAELLVRVFEPFTQPHLDREAITSPSIPRSSGRFAPTSPTRACIPATTG